MRTVNGILFVAWVALLSLLLYINYYGSSPLSVKPHAVEKAFEKKTFWYDIYVKQKKIGYASTSYENVGNEIIIEDERRIKVKKDGKDSVLIGAIKSLCDAAFSIKSFEYHSYFEGEKGITVRGNVEPDAVVFFLESSGKRKVHTIGIKNTTLYLPMTLMPVLIKQRPAPNSVFAVPLLDLVNLAIRESTVVLEEIRPLKIGMDVLSLYRLKTPDTIWWCNEMGYIVKEEHSNGMTLYSQVEGFAKDPAERTLFDYTS
ncbi:MAG: hypothetical protein AB1442_03330, partial [Nitrospirota bacterium]